MKVLLIEDDYYFADAIRLELVREFKDIQVDTIETESAFLERFPVLVIDPPSVIILDMILRYSDDPVKLPAIESFKGGLRCLAKLQESQETRAIPVILHSAGSAIPPQLPTNVVCVPKSGNSTHLLNAMRSVLFANRPEPEQSVFLVHGHDGHAKEVVARFIEKLGLRIVVLQEQPNRGKAIFEKLEAHSHAAFAVVLLTPDDIGSDRNNPSTMNPRARQNVILELGYFIGRLGKSRVCALLKDTVELPSDYHGILYIEFDSNGGWRTQLASEMLSAGLHFDPRKVLGL